MSDSHLFRLARECSLKSDYKGCASARVGAIVVYKHTILAKGFNSDKTHTTQKLYNKWRYESNGNNYLPEKVHSEIMALEKIKFLDIDFSKVCIYIYRETRDGHIAMARPCKACLMRIKSLGITTIKYTTYEGYCTEKLI